jgi:hypothetical protein
VNVFIEGTVHAPSEAIQSLLAYGYTLCREAFLLNGDDEGLTAKGEPTNEMVTCALCIGAVQ